MKSLRQSGCSGKINTQQFQTERFLTVQDKTMCEVSADFVHSLSLTLSLSPPFLSLHFLTLRMNCRKKKKKYWRGRRRRKQHWNILLPPQKSIVFFIKLSDFFSPVRRQEWRIQKRKKRKERDSRKPCYYFPSSKAISVWAQPDPQGVGETSGFPWSEDPPSPERKYGERANCFDKKTHRPSSAIRQHPTLHHTPWPLNASSIYWGWKHHLISQKGRGWDLFGVKTRFNFQEREGCGIYLGDENTL